MLHKLLKPARCCCRYRRDVSQLTEINAKLVLALEHYKAIERGEHAEFDDEGSNCCGAGAYDTDPDIDMER